MKVERANSITHVSIYPELVDSQTPETNCTQMLMNLSYS